MTTLTIDAKELKKFDSLLSGVPVAIEQSARLAVNEAARFGRVQSSREIFSQMNLLKGYIDQRLTVRLSPKSGEPEAVITGRFKPTSLSQFLTKAPQRGKPLSVRVKRGGPVQKIKGFQTRLNQGAALTDTKYNVGVAIRLAPGKSLRNSQGAKLLRSDKYGDTFLLYGPSINQVFRTVKDDVAGPIQDRLRSEFTRQFARLNRG